MKKTVRFLALILAALMSLSLLAGCGGGEEEQAAAPEAPAQAAPEEAAPDAAAPDAAAPDEAPEQADGEAPPPPDAEPSGESGEPAEAPAEFVALDPKGDYSRDWAGYQAYLAEACDVETAFPDDEMRQQVKEQIAAASEADYDAAVFPYEMLIGMHIAVSYDEFLAA